MQPTPQLDRVFPLCGGSSERARLRAPRLPLLVKPTPGGVLGHRAFMRAWAARRAARSTGNLPVPPEARGQIDGATAEAASAF